MASTTDQLLVCDLTQSYSPKGGGGISTYLKEKQRFIRDNTNHRLLQIVPGPETKIVEDGRLIWCEIAAGGIENSPNYRFITKTGPVREVLERYRPDIIESLCPWVLPWTAINHRRHYPETALVAGYRTDFPEAQVHRVAVKLFGRHLARFWRWQACCYGEITYREFDRVYVLGEDSIPTLTRMKVHDVDRLKLGVHADLFSPDKADPGFRAEMGLDHTKGPLLIYAGRIDYEKGADQLIEMFRKLPAELDAALVMLGDGKLTPELKEAAKGMAVAFPGFLKGRTEMARALASSDVYVSAMPSETFGISIIEAQACGLPVIGVDSGAMPSRVSPSNGVLVPVGNTDAMAQAVQNIWPARAEAMGREARAVVEREYSWDATFTHLFDTIYPKALDAAEARVRRGPLGFRPVHKFLNGTA
ncbi:glycosyltransferase [Alteriqipengyuania lutimaris]|uniref:Glycosyltransferase n=1 Tax=Alteriqipengyuania lutimaris TaxID=1538146 RepID=A0A395LMD9_9SPHN|nr:glycosyltransferase [Alteriqipengyuania lutimaris]MBB3033419.1 alpha-1,6-mannosyltransferase [Alteriqipengyuania lutimaris]RDS77557.1 glycosyltransferase [Alteriqipengyuania lutimaris]